MVVRHAVILFMILSSVVAVRGAEAQAVPATPDTVAAPPRPALPPPSVRAWQLGLARPDRIQHVSLSLTIGLGAGLISRHAGAAAAGSLGCGLAKELYDIPRTGFDGVDLLADLIGAAAAAAITAGVLD